MIGRRVYPNDEGWLSAGLEPGDYGHATNPETEGHALSWWQIACPDGSQGSLNPAIHTVTENEDGTITVIPSIVSATWHGWLKAGVWTKV